MKQVYLDYAAATPIDKEVTKAMQAAEAYFANPSAQYASGRAAKDQLAMARKNIAMFLNANTDEIIFTSGATEANNLAILGSTRAVGAGNVVSVKTEHASVREPINQLKAEGFTITWAKVNKDGLLGLEELTKSLNKDTKLISIAYANSEFGTIQPIAKIVKIVRDFEKANNCKIIIHTDASAAALSLNCDVARLGIDLLTISGSKIYGPKGIGALYIKRGTKLKPIIYGGAQENSTRAGSESLPLVVGFSEALNLVKQNSSACEQQFKNLYNTIRTELEDENFIATGSSKKRLFSIASYIFEGISGEDLVAYLDAKGFEVSTGAACEASNKKPSAGLLALGYSSTEAQGSLRVSFGRSTTTGEVYNFTKALKQTLLVLRKQKA